MAMMLQGGPFKAPVAGFRRFTVPEYHKMIAAGVLTENDRVELLEGYLVEKMPQDPSHSNAIELTSDALGRVLPGGWYCRAQLPVTLAMSEPEPDVCVARGDRRTYGVRHPRPADVGIIVEVANTSLDTDRDDKTAIYARANVATYWIVNVVDRQVEVYEQPSGPTANPGYAACRVYKPGDAVPVVLDGNTIGTIPVNDLLP